MFWYLKKYIHRARVEQVVIDMTIIPFNDMTIRNDAIRQHDDDDDDTSKPTRATFELRGAM